MNACQKFAIALAAVVLLGVVLNVPDIARYVKLRAM